MNIRQTLQEIWKGTNSNQRFIGSVLLLVLVISAVGGGYYLVYEKNRITCLSCLSLQPVAGDFEGWWIEYPEGSSRAGEEVSHPEEVVDALSHYKAVMIFFWQTDCTGCEKQWKEMRKYGLVTGDEAKGQLDKYKDVAFLFSVDLTSGNPDYTKNIHWFRVYDAFENSQTPLTVFVTHYQGNIGWYSHSGVLSPGDVDDILNIATAK